jgi:hypothetical protein
MRKTFNKPMLVFSVELKKDEDFQNPDKMLAKLLKKKPSGGGMMLGSNVRDVDFDFATFKEAMMAVEKAIIWATAERRRYTWTISICGWGR